MNACPDEHLEDFVRGDLVGAAAVSVRRHLDGCAACTDEVTWLRREREAVSEALFTSDPLPPASRVLSLAAPPRHASWLGALSMALAPAAALVAIALVGARPVAATNEAAIADARISVPACFLGGDADEGMSAVELAFAACLVASPRPGRVAEIDPRVTDHPLSSLGSEACE